MFSLGTFQHFSCVHMCVCVLGTVLPSIWPGQSLSLFCVLAVVPLEAPFVGGRLCPLRHLLQAGGCAPRGTCCRQAVVPLEASFVGRRLAGAR